MKAVASSYGRHITVGWHYGEQSKALFWFICYVWGAEVKRFSFVVHLLSLLLQLQLLLLLSVVVKISYERRRLSRIHLRLEQGTCGNPKKTAAHV